MTRPKIVEIKAAGDNHEVVGLKGSAKTYRREPCPTCPWRVDAVGKFPAEAFKHSACTAHDMSSQVFSCHESGTAKPATCAGFLLRGAKHNLAVRIRRIDGSIEADVVDQGHQLHENYRAMAIANGVPPDDEALRLCRD